MSHKPNPIKTTRVPYRVGGKTIGTIRTERYNYDPTNPADVLFGTFWYEGITPDGRVVCAGNDRSYVQRDLRLAYGKGA